MDIGQQTLANGFGQWTMEIVHRTLDIVYWTFDMFIPHWTMDNIQQILDIGHWPMDTRQWTMDNGTIKLKNNITMEKWKNGTGQQDNGNLEHLDIEHITWFTAAAARTFE